MLDKVIIIAIIRQIDNILVIFVCQKISTVNKKHFVTYDVKVLVSSYETIDI